jgi:hypothetical protein
MTSFRPVLALFAILCLVVLSVHAADSPTGVVCGSATGTQGSTILVPVQIAGVAEPIGTLDLTLQHNAALVSAIEVLPGDFNATLEPAIDPGIVGIRVQAQEAFAGSGTVAWIRYQILAPSGSTPLTLLHVSGTWWDGSTLFLSRTDGRLTILPGISFTRSADTLRVTVSTDAPKDVVRIEGNNITLLRDRITFTIVTDGLGVSATRSTGLIRQVIAKSPIASANLSGYPVNSWYEVILSTYLSEASLHLDLTEQIPLEQRNITKAAAERSRLTPTAYHLLATPTLHGIPEGAAWTQYFTLPASLENRSANESLWVAVLSGSSSADLVKIGSPVEKGENGDGIYRVALRKQPASLVLFSARELPRPEGTAAPSPGSLLFPGTEAGSNSLWVAMILIFLLVGIVVVSVFYVHRKRGG